MKQLQSERYVRGLLTVDSSAYSHNVAAIRQWLPPETRLMAIVKANGYGSTVDSLPADCGIDILGVADIQEAHALRQNGYGGALLVLQAEPHHAEALIAAEVEVAVASSAMIDALGSVAEKEPCRLHLHVDTGMNNYGCKSGAALPLATQIEKHPHLTLEGVMTHFCCAEEPANDAVTDDQRQRFDAVIAELESAAIQAPWIHAANSSAALRFPDLPYTMVRIGLAFHGATLSEACRQAVPLRGTMTLTSHITSMRTINQGESVSYGGSYTAYRSVERVATIPLGYHDGIHRCYSNRGSVRINGKRAPIVGTVSMDSLIIDATEIDAAVGDTVLFFGYDAEGRYRSPESFAEEGGSHVHELMATLGPRITRKIR